MKKGSTYSQEGYPERWRAGGKHVALSCSAFVCRASCVPGTVLGMGQFHGQDGQGLCPRGACVPVQRWALNKYKQVRANILKQSDKGHENDTSGWEENDLPEVTFEWKWE